MKTDKNQVKTWILPKPVKEKDNYSLNYILQKVLIRRGFDLHKELDDYITPKELPNPEFHFNELKKATDRIIDACARNDQIAICGDYDADGMTSTVLLVELLTLHGAKVTPYIPSRHDDGYGLNVNMISDINSKQIKLIITVDNGISAFDAIKKAKEFGIDVIITDHHRIPDKKLDIHSLIHPERTPNNSPYKYLAGVGIAYLLGKNICQKLNFDINSTTANVLFSIGTVADMAPLKGANRKWLKDFLPNISKTNNNAVRSIIKKLSINENDITSEDIGYKIAPLINSVGRISDPKIIIDLFTNKSKESIDRIVNNCFEINKERKRLTALIEEEAFKIAKTQYFNGTKFLVLTKREWHPGIIGIVAARVVDKYNLPTAILSLANDGNYRGSIRSNTRLKVNLALEECSDLLIAHGGHSDAAGFSIKEENIDKLMARLDNIAKKQFKNIDLNRAIRPDAYMRLADINYDFYRQLSFMAPFGIMNPAPIFWTRKCEITKISKLNGGHIKMTLNDGTCSINAIKWNETTKLKNNDLIDIAYYIELNKWKRRNNLQLNIIDIKTHTKVIELKIHKRTYKCQLKDNREVLITNTKGDRISSDFSMNSININKNQLAFAEKILTFAEIALGKAS